jgi:UDP-N-acetylmuramoylalanyl-D-glutamate--2,6-diaminopimelate ligase (EC 6.3.2.13)
MDIKKLLKKIEYTSIHGNTNVDIKGIAYDSRKVKKDYIFVAIPGEKDDGTKYEHEAINNGAAVIVSKSYNPAIEHALQIVVNNQDWLWHYYQKNFIITRVLCCSLLVLPAQMVKHNHIPYRVYTKFSR